MLILINKNPIKKKGWIWKAELKYIENLEKSVMRLEKEANSLSEEAEREKKMSLLKD